MNITFENSSIDQAVKIEINNTSYIIKENSTFEITTTDNQTVFTAELLPVDFSAAFGENVKPEGLKERFLYKASKKFTEKIPDMGLSVAVTYEFSTNYNNVLIEILEEVYSVADGEVADFFDMTPIAYSFPRMESNFGDLNICDTHTTNRKNFLRLYRTAQLFLDYFFFIEIYALAMYYSSDKYVKRMISKLYSMSYSERSKIIEDKTTESEKI